MQSNIGEIILYQPESSSNFRLEVRIEDETVWLTQAQMAELFNATKQNISLHISNIYREKELNENSTIKESLTVQKEGNRTIKRKISYYNLDVIISVGYRVKSQRGTQFRIWATRILKDYLLKGYAVSQRLERIEQKIIQHDQQFEFFLKTSLPPNEGIFYDGQIFDAWQFVSRIIREAKTSIILIDNYVDEITLSLLSKKNKKVNIVIYTHKIPAQLNTDIEKYKVQYGNIEIKAFQKSHDRFLIIDHKEVYHIGASLKDLGKKWFAFSKLKIDTQLILNELSKEQ